MEDAISKSDFVVTMLPNTQIVKKLMLEDGVFDNVKKDAFIIDSSTISPGGAQELHSLAKKRGITFVDAPVSGGVVGADNATLAFMVGAENEAIFEVNQHNNYLRNVIYFSPTWVLRLLIVRPQEVGKSPRHVITWH